MTMGTHHAGYAFPPENISCAYAPVGSPRSSPSESEPPLAQTTARRSRRRAAPGAHPDACTIPSPNAPSG